MNSSNHESTLAAKAARVADFPEPQRAFTLKQAKWDEAKQKAQANAEYFHVHGTVVAPQVQQLP